MRDFKHDAVFFFLEYGSCPFKVYPLPSHPLCSQLYIVLHVRSRTLQLFALKTYIWIYLRKEGLQNWERFFW